MSTRKATKKAPAKKAPTKKTAKKAVARMPTPAPAPTPVPIPEPTPIVVAAVPVQETFVSQPTTPPTTAVPPERVLVYVNGSPKGQILHGGKTLGEFAKSLAQEHGIRTFSIYVDEQKANTTMADMKLDTVGKIEIVPKDSRG